MSQSRLEEKGIDEIKNEREIYDIVATTIHTHGYKDRERYAQSDST